MRTEDVTLFLDHDRLQRWLGGKPARVVIATAEDSWEQTVVPRLIAAEADLSLISRVDVGDPAFPRGPILPDDAEALMEVMKIEEVRLLVIDPLVAHLGIKVDSHNDKSTRSALAPLHRLAEETGAAVIGVVHMNKSDARTVVMRVGGSVGFVGFARSILIWDHENKEQPDDYRVMVHGKCNVSREGTSRRFKIESVEIEGDDGQPIKTARIVCAGNSDLTVADILSAPKRQRVRDDAADWLAAFLSSGAMSKKDVEAAATRGHIAWRTVLRAADQLGIDKKRVGSARADGRCGA